MRKTLQDYLRALYRTIDAEGGAANNEYDAGYNQALTQASVHLEAAGFTEGHSEAADKIDALIATLQECEEYFDNRADADCDQDGFIPNNEMRLLTEVRAALAKAGAA